MFFRDAAQLHPGSYFQEDIQDIMDGISDILFHPFTWGLGLGLLMTGMVWKSARLKQKMLRAEIGRLDREIEELSNHLNIQMKITARGSEQLQQEVDQLKDRNENLRINLAALQQKPDRSEVRTLYLYDRAIHIMYENAPGFAPAWEKALREAEDYMARTENGIVRLIKRLIRPAAGLPALPPETGQNAGKLRSSDGEGEEY